MEAHPMIFQDRQYQKDAAEWLAARRRGVIQLAAGGGKTRIAAMALNAAVSQRNLARKVRIGWCGNTHEQISQALSALGRFQLLQQQDIKVACAAAQTDWSDRDVLVVDECHTALAPTHALQIQACKGRIWGLTATFPTDPIKASALTNLIGESLVIPREAVQANLAPAVVRWIDATDPNLREPIDAEIDRVVKIRERYWSGDAGQLWGNVAWQVVVEMGIIANAARNAAAIAAATNDRPTLVLINQVEHAHTLSAQIPGAKPCYSAMGAKARREVLEDFIAGKCRCLVASSLCDEGFDAPNAEVLVLVSAGKSAARTEQRTGRVLRQFQGKTHAVVHDFLDLYHPLPAKHARLRGELYSKLGYTILP